MSWDYRFGALILLSTAIDYYVGLRLSDESRERVRYYLLLFSLITNLVFILGFFKYYNFLVTSVNTVTNPMFGADALPVLKIILPAGISFFTFQSLSYTIDVYRKEIPAEKDFIRFALFVSFFPQLVAGPIVTARTFMPQLYTPKKLEDIEFRVAIRFFMLGYFKKAVLSDMVAPTIDTIYADPAGHHAYALLIAAALGGIQVYLDFSGYSDMAIGSAMLLGYRLPTNFNLPFLATSVSGFWRRWHMTLNSWLRDYIYIPMGGSRVTSVRRKFNLWFTMFVSGVWHGAQWTFVFWGSLNGVFYVLEEVWKEWFPDKKGNSETEPWYKIPLWLFQNLLNSSVFFLGAVFFRSLTWENAWIHIRGIFTFQAGQIRPYMWKDFLWVLFFLYLGHIIGYFIFEKGKGKQIPASLEFAVYPILFLVLNLATPENSVPFIYFQF